MEVVRHKRGDVSSQSECKPISKNPRMEGSVKGDSQVVDGESPAECSSRIELVIEGDRPPLGDVLSESRSKSSNDNARIKVVPQDDMQLDGGELCEAGCSSELDPTVNNVKMTDAKTKARGITSSPQTLDVHKANKYIDLPPAVNHSETSHSGLRNPSIKRSDFNAVDPETVKLRESTSVLPIAQSDAELKRVPLDTKIDKPALDSSSHDTEAVSSSSKQSADQSFENEDQNRCSAETDHVCVTSKLYAESAVSEQLQTAQPELPESVKSMTLPFDLSKKDVTLDDKQLDDGRSFDDLEQFSSPPCYMGLAVDDRSIISCETADDIDSIAEAEVSPELAESIQRCSVSVKLMRCKVTDKDIAMALANSVQAVDVEPTPTVINRTIRRFHCHGCPNRFRSPAKLISHASLLHNVELSLESLMEKVDGCPHCGKKYGLYSSQYRHNRQCASANKPGASKVVAESSTATRMKVLRCLKCNRVFLNKKSLTTHITRRHHVRFTESMYEVQHRSGKDLFKPKCRMCSYTASTWRQVYFHEKRHPKSEMRRHDSLKQASRKHCCSLCRKIFVNSSQLSRHQKLVHGKKNASVNPSSEHDRLKSERALYFCHLCGVSVLQGSIAKHLRRIHKTDAVTIPLTATRTVNKVIACLYCNKSYSRSQRMYRHLSHRHDSIAFTRRAQPVTCNHCNLKFQNELQLRHHISIAHKVLTKSESMMQTSASTHKQIENLVYPCSRCGKVLSSLATLEKHMRCVHFIKGTDAVTIEGIPRSHAKDSVPVCKLCDILFESWRKLYTHLHKGTCANRKKETCEKYCCPVCGLAFRNQNALNGHKSGKCGSHKTKASNVARKKRMRENSLKAESSSSQKMARADISNPPALICSLCDGMFTSSDGLRKHLRKIHRLKEEKCKSVVEQAQQQAPPAPKSTDSDLKSMSDIVNVKTEKVTTSSMQATSCRFDSNEKPTTALTTSNSETETLPSNSVQVFSCELCDMSYHSLKSLHRHSQERHSQVMHRPVKVVKVKKNQPATAGKSFSCNHCSFTSKYAANVNRHSKRVHGCKFVKPVGMTSTALNKPESKVSRPRIKREEGSVSSATNPSDSIQFYDSDSSTSTDSDSSSSDSLSDEGCKALKLPVSIDRRTLCLSSSSSSDSSSAEDDGQVDIPTLQKTEGADELNNSDLDGSAASKDLPSVGSVHSLQKVSCHKNQLLSDEILQLDQNIFAIDKQSDSGGILQIEHHKPAASQTGGATNIDCTVQGDLYDNSIGDSVEQKNDCVEKLNASTNGDSSTNIMPSDFQASESGNCEEKFISHVGARSRTTDTHAKSTPVAVLKPFSSVPEGSIVSEPCSSQASTADSPFTFTPISVINVNPTPTSVSVSRTLSGSQTSSNADLNSSSNALSLPVYYVNLSEYILPYLCNNLCEYRRITINPRTGGRQWSYLPWYEDFGVCDYRLVALVAKPLQSANQVDSLIPWILANKLARLPPESGLTRVNNMSRSLGVDVSKDASNRAVCPVSLCYLCGVLVRDDKERHAHSSLRHPPCTRCRKPLVVNKVHRCALSARPAKTEFFPLSGAICSSNVPWYSSPQKALNCKVSDEARSSNSLPSLQVENLSRSTNAGLGGTVSSELNCQQPGKQQPSCPTVSTSRREVSDGYDILNQNLSSETSSILEKQSYHCSFCNMDFLLKVQHEHHVITLHKKCPLCSKVFENRQARSEHVIANHNRCICLACDLTVANDKAVEAHIVQEHVDEVTGLFNCTRCRDKQIHPEAINDHLAEDDLEMNRKCHLCLSTLPVSSTASFEHFCSHALPETTTICVECGLIYLEPWALKLHLLNSSHRFCELCLLAQLGPSHDCPNPANSMAVHPSVKSEAQIAIARISSKSSNCRICSQRVTNMSLRRHCDEEHSEFRIQCEECGLRFQFDHQKKFHMGVHKRNWKYTVCSRCLNVTFSALLSNKPTAFHILNRCGQCTHYSNCKQPPRSPRNADAPVSADVVKNMIVIDSSVSIQDVQTHELNSGDVQLMLDGKLYNFNPTDGADTEATRSIPVDSKPAVNNEDDHSIGSTGDSDSDVLFIDESKAPISVTPAGVSACSTNKPAASKPSTPASKPSTRFSCQHCGFKCNFMAALNKHMQKKHA